MKRELTLGRTEMIDMMTQRMRVKETKRGQERIKENKENIQTIKR